MRKPVELAATAPLVEAMLRWILVVVFSVSGIAKLRRPTLAAVAIVDFGVASKVRPWAGSALGAAEFLLALLLAVRLGTPVVEATAFLLLALFTALMWRSVKRNDSFPCFCFGDSSEVVTYRTFFRTSALAAIGATVAGFAGGGPVSYAHELYAAVGGVAVAATTSLISRVPSLIRWNALKAGV